MSSTLTWGTPPTPSPPSALDPADGLQPLVDAIAASASGGVISLEPGTYYADPANPSTPLTIPAAAYDLSIVGESAQGVIIGSPILCQTGKLHLSDMHIDPPAGSAYGVKIYNGGSPFISRCNFERIIIGDRAQVKTNGPTNGLQIDGAGVFQASNCTFAFCAGNGLLVDSTGVEPNTTLQFDMCSFVQNGAYGIKVMGSCTIAEFRGGNSEGNVSGEVYAESMNSLVFSVVDFETQVLALTNQVEVNGCRPVSFRDCNFLVAGTGSATRALIISNSDSVVVENCTFGGWGNVGVIRVSSDCSRCNVHNNLFAGATPATAPYVEDYSR